MIMEQVAIARCAIEHVWVVAVVQIIIVCLVRVTVLFLGHNAFATLVL
jgi:hypothetical protein